MREGTRSPWWATVRREWSKLYFRWTAIEPLPVHAVVKGSYVEQSSLRTKS